ncbi:MAG: signal peptide peptidase SppA [Mariprofundaceae bacterium]
MHRFFSSFMHILGKIRSWTLNLIFLLMVTLFLLVVFSGLPDAPDNAVLVLDLKGELVEAKKLPSADSALFSIPAPNQVVVRDVVKVLELAARDTNIRAIRLKLESLQATSLAKLQSIRLALQSFQKSGKQVIAIGNNYSQGQYYLAATSDKIFLHPMGTLGVTGFSVYRNYFKSALEKLGVDVHLFRVGKYKSALEPFIRDNMSEEDRNANRLWLNRLWQIYKADISAMRGVDSQRIQYVLDHFPEAISRYSGSIANLAKGEGFVDVLADKHDAEAWMRKELFHGGDMATIDYKSYLQLTSLSTEGSQKSQNNIGIITASGVIVGGEQPSGTVGGDTVAGLLRDARLDDSVKAVVLRVDSPGGSALASEVIRQEVLRLRQAAKPILVSMGSLAASGGYWIAANADEIWAEPATLTGSIGVFGMIPTAPNAFARLGIHSDGVGTTAISEGIRLNRPLSPALKGSIQMGVEDIYKRFIRLVADGRGMDVEAVDAIAQGRVWSAMDAQKNGLVDHVGNMKDVIVAAATRAGVLGHYNVMHIEPKRDMIDILAENLLGELQSLLDDSITSYMPLLSKANPWLTMPREIEAIRQFHDPTGIYAYQDIMYGE